MFGALWVVFNPLVMLAIFALVFGHIFQSRWPQENAGLPYWLNLYIGLIVFNVFSETVSRSPSAVRSYPSFVKKIIFPVIILPVVPLGAALVQGLISFLILFAALIWADRFSSGVLLLPLLLIPAMLLALGISWFISAWGVFMKDLTQVVPILMQMLMFLSPVLYPINAVPSQLRPIYQYNPLASVIDASRAAVVHQSVDWPAWTISLVVGVVVLIIGYSFFQASREEFADVL